MNESHAAQLRAIENATGILQLRLSTDEWARTIGEKTLPQFTTRQLLASIATTALLLTADFPEAS